MIFRLFFIFFIGGNSLFGSHIDDAAVKLGFERNYAKALEHAQAKGKIFLVVLSKEDCSWCKRFERRTFADENVLKKLKENYVVILLDKEAKEEYPYGKYETKITPKCFFVDPKTGAIIKETIGYVRKDDFAQLLDQIVAYKRN